VGDAPAPAGSRYNPRQDVTNLSDPKAGHMKNLIMVFDGKDRLSQEWTWSAGGKDATEIFQYQRAAS
jgi:hypothetical protein